MKSKAKAVSYKVNHPFTTSLAILGAMATGWYILEIVKIRRNILTVMDRLK